MACTGSRKAFAETAENRWEIKFWDEWQPRLFGLDVAEEQRVFQGRECAVPR